MIYLALTFEHIAIYRSLDILSSLVVALLSLLVKRKSCDKVDEADDVGKLIVEEERESGSVKLAVYLTYAKLVLSYIMYNLAKTVYNCL